MSYDPDTYRAMVQIALESHDKQRPRSQQSLDGVLGISDIGWCREYCRRVLVNAPRTDSPSPWAAMVGTYIDAGVEEALRSEYPKWILKPRIEVTLPLPDGRTVVVPGTGDIADPDEPSYTDAKTKDGLAVARRTWHEDTQYFMQRNLCYTGLINGYDFPQDGVVRNVVFDRSGSDPEHFVWQEPYNPDAVLMAGEWLGDVFYAVEHGEEASKDVQGHLCRSCPFFTACRGSDVTVGPISNDRLASAVNEYGRAKQARDEAKGVLDGLRDTVLNVNGWTDEWQVTTTKVSTTGSQRILVKPR